MYSSTYCEDIMTDNGDPAGEKSYRMYELSFQRNAQAVNPLWRPSLVTSDAGNLEYQTLDRPEPAKPLEFHSPMQPVPSRIVRGSR